jgi:hypothetical protein
VKIENRKIEKARTCSTMTGPRSIPEIATVTGNNSRRLPFKYSKIGNPVNALSGIFGRGFFYEK